MMFSFNISDEHIWSSICIYKSEYFAFSTLIELGCKKAAKKDIRIMCNEI